MLNPHHQAVWHGTRELRPGTGGPPVEDTTLVLSPQGHELYFFDPHLSTHFNYGIKFCNLQPFSHATMSHVVPSSQLQYLSFEMSRKRKGSDVCTWGYTLRTLGAVLNSDSCRTS